MTSANNHFGSSNVSEVYFSDTPWQILLSCGVNQLAKECRAFWLINLIIAYQCKPEIKQERFQTWELVRKEDQSFDIFSTDGNGHILTTQQIQYSDFPYDQATLWLVDGALLLPCEY